MSFFFIRLSALSGFCNINTSTVFVGMKCPRSMCPQTKSFGRFVPWTRRPLDNASLGRCVLSHGVPDRCVLTLDRIDVLDVTSYFGLGLGVLRHFSFCLLFLLQRFFLLTSLFIMKKASLLPLSLSLWFPGSLQVRPSMYLMPWNFNELYIGCPPQKEFSLYCELGPKPEKTSQKTLK